MIAVQVLMGPGCYVEVEIDEADPVAAVHTARRLIEEGRALRTVEGKAITFPARPLWVRA